MSVVCISCKVRTEKELKREPQEQAACGVRWYCTWKFKFSRNRLINHNTEKR